MSPARGSAAQHFQEAVALKSQGLSQGQGFGGQDVERDAHVVVDDFCGDAAPQGAAMQNGVAHALKAGPDEGQIFFFAAHHE